MKTLHSVTKKVTFHVLADDEKEAEEIADALCPIDEHPRMAVIDTRVYRTPNQSNELKKVAANYPGVC